MLEDFKKYFGLFVSAIILVSSLILLILFGMTAIVVILLILGIAGCLTFAILAILGKKDFMTLFAEKISSTIEAKKNRPRIVPDEEVYAGRESNNSLSEQEQNEEYSKRAIITDDDEPTVPCPSCKYKNYKNEKFCQNCGEPLKQKE